MVFVRLNKQAFGLSQHYTIDNDVYEAIKKVLENYNLNKDIDHDMSFHSLVEITMMLGRTRTMFPTRANPPGCEIIAK